MEQKTGSKNKVIIALAILTIVVLLIGVWAFARYTSTVSGTGTAAVASWSFKANEETKTMTNINLIGTISEVNGKVAPDHIAPGTSGSFDVRIDATGSEVAVAYSVELSNFTNLPQNLKFYTDAAHQNPITDNSGKYTVTGYIAYSDVTDAMKKTTKIYWDWPYQTPGSGDVTTEDNDKKDTADAGKDVSCTITVTGWQSNPNNTNEN